MSTISKKQTTRQKDITHKKIRHSRLLSVVKYLPAIVLLATAYNVHSMPLISKTTAPRQVLSYATSMNITDLLTGTNSQRSDNGVQPLTLSTELNNAAQTKANDMVTRDYWSHTTPDGIEPWVFMTNAGYQYKTAGENLAYGFDTGSLTISGWMNSPPHRQNLLNNAFTNVGFGFANSDNYVGTGQQTVIVAMYGAPLSQPAVAAPSSEQPPVPVSAAPKPSVKQVASTTAPSSPTPPATTPPATPIQPTELPPNPVVATQSQPKQKAAPQAVLTSQKDPVVTTYNVKRIQLLTGGNAIWSSSIILLSLGVVGTVWAFQNGRQLRRFAMRGERYAHKHFHLDLTVISFFVLGTVLLQTAGIVR